MVYKTIPPKLYVVEHDGAAYLYDSTQGTHLCSAELNYWLIFLYWTDEDPEGHDCLEPGDCKYVLCSEIDAIPEGNFKKVLATEAPEDWYKFDDDEDENTEEVYSKYMDEWEEYCICNHHI